MKIIVLNNQSGYVLYLAIIILLILFIYTASILSANHHTTLHAVKRINKLQASVCAYSGLNLVQAYVKKNLEDEKLFKDTTLLKTFDDIGTMEISIERSTGWLNVTSTGIRFKDSAHVEGVLGQILPKKLTENVLNVNSLGSNLVIAQRAKVYGNIGIPPGKGVIENTDGKFVGRTIGISPIKFDDTFLEKELNNALYTFNNRSSLNYVPDSISQMDFENFKEDISKKSGDIFINKNLIITDTLDLSAKCLWIKGHLVFKDQSKVTNIKAYVTGNTFISGRSQLEIGTLCCFGDVRIKDRSKVRLNIACAESLCVSDNAIVEYPSVLYLSFLMRKKAGKRSQMVLVSDRAKITGTIIVGNNTQSLLSPKVIISGRTSINGILYSPSAVTINGKIAGNVTVGKLIYEKPNTLYDGWLMETTMVKYNLTGMIIPLIFPNDCNPQYIYSKTIKKRI